MLKKFTSNNLHRIARGYFEGFNNNKIRLVAVTGGPCAGKTTALMNITENFSSTCKVFTIPELATIAINGGINLVPDRPLDERKHLTKEFVKLLMAVEDYYIEAAKVEEKDVLIVADRGVMDPKAYIEPEAFDEVLEELGQTEDQVTNDRYDLVCHMVTAADGFEECYQLKNNRARSETPEKARNLDKKIQEVWMKHDNFRILSATKQFDTKIDDIYSVIANLLKTDSSYEMSKKYVLPNDVKIDEIQPKDTNKASFYEKIDYLIDHNDESKRVCLKKRTSESGQKTYSHIITNIIEDGKKQTEKNNLGKDVYDLFMKQKNNRYKTLYRKITSFIDKSENYVISEYYEDQFYNKKSLTLLLAESLMGKNGKSLTIPSYLEDRIVHNVAGTEKLSSWNLAQNDKKDTVSQS